MELLLKVGRADDVLGAWAERVTASPGKRKERWLSETSPVCRILTACSYSEQ